MDSKKDYSRLRQMHRQELPVSIDKLFRFLCGWLGGPRLYREKYGPISIPQVHRHLNVNSIEKQQWLSCMQEAIAKQNYSPEFSEYLITQLKIPAQRIVDVGDFE